MSKLFARFAKDESGATAIEYGLIAAIMAVALIAAFPFVTGGLTTSFTNIGTMLGSTPSTIN
ncbi:MAG: Flp family type IVb pilin [Aurantimonas coralicida]|jgi:pilus assembly protein Flp/PilA|uniref:Flp pilus assembly protein n=1 Tax=Aurantimonas coralicida TaxID=182270 RepID=A0A0P0YYQ0_9HYPH|nr:MULTISPECIES: Flp family type IVb pilin [Aurantimonas]MAY30449.1 Flp family type IVb pilin [Aurantimonas sp.]MCW7543990.1 Flp family type IVb pilin [Aurantimonas litoralis]MBC6717773.1 Flp family type IVb pilin [Aurantimonas sp. DM33-3]MCC4297843.1 Flp family type IVb pilin [Aurantimonas coralicida]MCD1644917.1 Flp family type IVb pilin [Aurantimonas coralicida]|tara:strand:+ start:281 stop:466 length:186 start_codon:yes stop_codon:yes gene_type:complete